MIVHLSFPAKLFLTGNHCGKCRDNKIISFNIKTRNEKNNSIQLPCFAIEL